jgi:hypothetical protein
MQIGKAARSNGSHIKSRLKMEPHGVFKEVTKQCTNKDHYQSCLQLRLARSRKVKISKVCHAGHVEFFQFRI